MFLTVTAAFLASMLVVAATVLGLAAHARDAARIAALQPDRPGAEAAVDALFDASTHAHIRSDGNLVTVVLQRRVELGRITGFTLTASATAVEETPW